MKTDRPDICPFMGVCSDQCRFFRERPNPGGMGSDLMKDKCVLASLGDLSKIEEILKNLAETVAEIKNLLKGE